MIDIHSHLLPMADDGAEDIKESIEMAKIYLENGINKVIVTPHFIEETDSNIREENLVLINQLKKALKDNHLDLEVFIGNEIYATMNIYEYIKEKKVSTLNDSRYVLLELPMFDIPLYIEELIYELLLKDYVPIIAHPERNAKIVENPNILFNLINKGALAQLNLPSLEGKYGDKIRTTGEILLKHNMIHFVGTDAHSTKRRSPNMSNSIDILKNLVDKETFNKITYLNSQCVLENKSIEIKPPIEYKKQKRFLHFIKNRISL